MFLTWGVTSNMSLKNHTIWHYGVGNPYIPKEFDRFGTVYVLTLTFKRPYSHIVTMYFNLEDRNLIVVWKQAWKKFDDRLFILGDVDAKSDPMWSERWRLQAAMDGWSGVWWNIDSPILDFRNRQPLPLSKKVSVDFSPSCLLPWISVHVFLPTK